MVKKLFAFAILCAAIWSPAPGFASDATADQNNHSAPAQPVNPTIEWNRTLLQIVRTKGAQPATIHSTRNFAILHTAIFDAVNSIDRTYTPYAIRLSHVSTRASVSAAADQAAHDVLVSLYPSFAAKLDLELADDLDSIPNGRNKADGIAVGEAVASGILALRRDDGSEVTLPPYVPKNQPGDYQLTPPNFAPADFIQWSRVTPFALKAGDALRPGAPPQLDSDEYTQSFNEVKSLGLINSTTRTADQTQIGKFWNGNIQDFWNEIAQTVVMQNHFGPVRTAHLFALLNISLADTAIAFFDAKYTYQLWRPVTAIQMGATDGNPRTEGDTTWFPLSTKTAPDPSYPGAHSAISAAAARILQSDLSDRITFTVTSESVPGATRRFTSLSEAAEEAGLSRIYAGQHFRFDHAAGKRLGKQVSLTVLKTSLRPR